MAERTDDQGPSRQLGASSEASSERLTRLRKRVGRRESILPADASGGVDDISDSWAIKTEAQLIHWVEHYPTEVLSMLITLREGHDARTPVKSS